MRMTFALAFLSVLLLSCGSAETRAAQPGLRASTAQDVVRRAGCPERPRLGLFVWDDEGRDATLALAHDNGVTEIYLHANLFYVGERDEALLAAWIREAAAHCIEVELLFGNALWMQPSMRAEAVQRTQWTVDFAERHPDARPTGVHWDLEPQQRETWSDDSAHIAIFGELLDTLDAMRPITARASMPLTLDMGFFLDELEFTRGGRTRPMHEWVIDAVDRVLVMDYRDEAGPMLEMASNELRYAAQVHVPMLLAVETRPIDEGEYVTFHEEGLASLRRVLAEVRAHEQQNASFAGLAIHDRVGLEALSP